MININGYLIDKNEVLLVWPEGKILLRSYGIVNVSSDFAKMLADTMATPLGPKAPPSDNEYIERDNPLPSSSSSRSQSFELELASLGQELHALCSRLALLSVVGHSCGLCGSEISLEND